MSTPTLESVFVTDSYPAYTYVSVDEGRVERELSDALEIPNKLISIVGPSKCGKTTLCDNRFGVDRGAGKIFITGDQIDSAEEFWKLAFLQCPEAADYDVGEFPGRATIVDILAANDLPVIIDDFHYIDDAEIQKKLCRQMKNAAASGVRFIILNTPHRGDDPVRSNPDLAGRFFSIDANFWNEEGLKEIARKGFSELQVDVDPEIIDRLAKESLGSPQMMQTLCHELGREYLSMDSPIAGQTIKVDRFDWVAVRSRAVRVYNNSALYEGLKKGPKRRGQQRNTYRLVSGEEGDVYEVMAYILATDPPFSSVTAEHLRNRAPKVIEKDQEPNFPAALDQLNELLGKDRPLDFDRGALHVVDPHFYFYLRAKAREVIDLD